MELTEPDKSPSMVWPIRRIHNGRQEEVDERVVLEEPLEITINGQPIAVLMRLPGQEKELATGFCITEGYVRRVTDILLLHHCGLGHPAPTEEAEGTFGSRNRVEMRVAADGYAQPAGADAVRLIRSGCGAAEVAALSETLPSVPYVAEQAVPVSTVLALNRAMRDMQEVYRQVGGTHAAALFKTTGEVVALGEDIGRHNAVDKAIGHCLLREIALSGLILVTSGRASYEMVSKAIRVGIPIAASISAPTALAVQLAEDRGLTLIGYLRGGRMNVYTHPERLQGA